MNTVINGDCVEKIKDVKSGSVHFSIFSPPFADLYVYGDDYRDMGNCASRAEFHDHFRFLVPELYRILMPGRLVAVHCMDLSTKKSVDGHIGLDDFSGRLIKDFQESGFIYHTRITIWKDPVVEMQRTKALGLLHKQIKKDSTMSRVGGADYILVFRKEGDNPEPVTHQDKDPSRDDYFPVDVWQKYASPVWMDINYSNTLQRTSARAEKDEKHICPLQLDTIERAIRLWTNPGDLVFSPFAGIGSEGFQAIKMGRRFYGIELKESYFEQATKNILAAEAGKLQMGLFAV